MIPASQLQIAEWVDGALIQGRPASVIESVSTDSRKVGASQLFVALKGDKFDAHHFLGDVTTNGASAILVSELPACTESFHGGIIRVKDTLAGLQAMAAINIVSQQVSRLESCCDRLLEDTGLRVHVDVRPSMSGR